MSLFVCLFALCRIFLLANCCRENFPSGVTSSRLVSLTIQFFNTEPRVMEKLRVILHQNKVRVVLHQNKVRVILHQNKVRVILHKNKVRVILHQNKVRFILHQN